MTTASLFSQKVHAARLAAVAVLAGLTVCSLPVAAQLGANDVTGIRLGASAADVEATLRALDPRFKYLTVYYPDANGKASTSVAAIKAAVQAGSDLRGIDWPAKTRSPSTSKFTGNLFIEDSIIEQRPLHIAIS